MSKRWFPFVTLITVNGSLFWHPFSAIASPIPLTQATLRKLVNQVELIIKDQQKRSARVNDQLSHGDALQTKESSRAELKFNDGTLAKVGERATFRFTPNTRRFDLQNGNYLFLVPPGRGPTEFYTPNAKAGVKGSALFLKYDAATDTTIMGALTNNPLGPMEITTKGQTQQVYAGQMVTVIKDRIDRVETFDLRTFYNTSVLFKDLDLKDPDVQAVRQELVDALTLQIALPADTPDAQRQAQTPEALQPSTVAAQPSVPRVTDPVGRTGLPTLDPVVAPLQTPPVVARPPIVDNPVATPPEDAPIEPPPIRLPVSPILDPEDNPPVKLPPKPILPPPMDPDPVDPRRPREPEREPHNDRREPHNDRREPHNDRREPHNDRREPHNDRREPHNARPKVEPIVIPRIEVTIETPKKDIKIELPRLEITIDRPDSPGGGTGQPKLEISTPDKPRIPEVKLALPEVLRPEAPKPEAPKLEAPKPEAPKLEAPKPEAPKPEAPKPEAPQPKDLQQPTATLPAPTQPEIVKVVPVAITEGPATPSPAVTPGPTIAPTDSPPTAVTPPVTPAVTPPVSAPPVTAPPVTPTPEVVPSVTTPPVTPPVTPPPAVIPPVVTAPPVTPTPEVVPPVTPPAATPPTEVPPTTPPVAPPSTPPVSPTP